MRLFRYFLMSLLSVFFTHSLYAQQDMGGFVFDAEEFKKLPRKVGLVTRSARGLAKSVSLAQYCPTAPKQKGRTCMAHALASAFTINEAKKRGIADNPEAISGFRFSAGFLYRFARTEGDNNCTQGLQVPLAIRAITEDGMIFEREYATFCAPSVPTDIRNKAQQYRINEAPTLFDRQDSKTTKIENVKKSLSEGKPVIWGFGLKGSGSTFTHVKEVWNNATEQITDYHAVVIVAYDDEQFGGAFQIFNSAGTNWGKNGFTWIRYDDFVNQGVCAFEVPPVGETIVKTEKPSNDIKPTPSVLLPQSKLATKLLLIREKDSKKLTLDIAGKLTQAERTTRGTGGIREKMLFSHILVKEPLYSGEGYQIKFDNEASAYIYILSTDMTQKIDILFPKSGQSALVGAGMGLDLPSENEVFYLDNTVGTDFLCILYSKEKLAIEELRDKITKMQGNSFLEKVEKALGDKLVTTESIKNTKFGLGEVDLEAPATSEKTVLPLVIQIEHK